ncbi:MAG: hypothetical protein PHE27_04675 [Alphaproteobacteria bacterium]|nr:hypothetical protein [Alphaproteobacteria bacterium]
MVEASPPTGAPVNVDPAKETKNPGDNTVQTKLFGQTTLTGSTVYSPENKDTKSEPPKGYGTKFYDELDRREAEKNKNLRRGEEEKPTDNSDMNFQLTIDGLQQYNEFKKKIADGDPEALKTLAALSELKKPQKSDATSAGPTITKQQMLDILVAEKKDGNNVKLGDLLTKKYGITDPEAVTEGRCFFWVSRYMNREGKYEEQYELPEGVLNRLGVEHYDPRQTPSGNVGQFEHKRWWGLINKNTLNEVIRDKQNFLPYKDDFYALNKSREGDYRYFDQETIYIAVGRKTPSNPLGLPVVGFRPAQVDQATGTVIEKAQYSFHGLKFSDKNPERTADSRKAIELGLDLFILSHGNDPAQLKRFDLGGTDTKFHHEFAKAAMDYKNAGQLPDDFKLYVGGSKFVYQGDVDPINKKKAGPQGRTYRHGPPI